LPQLLLPWEDLTPFQVQTRRVVRGVVSAVVEVEEEVLVRLVSHVSQESQESQLSRLWMRVRRVVMHNAASVQDGKSMAFRMCHMAKRRISIEMEYALEILGPGILLWNLTNNL
jgi:hypothetical protein